MVRGPMPTSAYSVGYPSYKGRAGVFAAVIAFAPLGDRTLGQLLGGGCTGAIATFVINTPHNV